MVEQKDPCTAGLEAEHMTSPADGWGGSWARNSLRWKIRWLISFVICYSVEELALWLKLPCWQAIHDLRWRVQEPHMEEE